jgi:hypothetical protein
MWGDQFAYDSAAVIKREHEHNQRERVKELARIRTEEDECFRLIRSQNEHERLEGYRQHLPLLGRKHQIEIQYHDSSVGSANFGRRRIRTPHIDSEANAATGYHEVGHILAGDCPNDGTVHRRDPHVTDWWNCVACEVAATRTALTLAPFTRPMFDRLARGLRSYRGTPAPMSELHKLDQLAGTISFFEHALRWRKWWDRLERHERAKAGLRRRA